MHVKNVGLKMITSREETKDEGILNLLLNKNDKKDKVMEEDQKNQYEKVEFPECKSDII